MRLYGENERNITIIHEDDKIMLLSFKVNKNSSTDNMAEAWDDCDKQFISYIVSWLSSDIYKKLKNDRSK